MNLVKTAVQNWKLLVVRIFPKWPGPDFPELCLAGSLPTPFHVPPLMHDAKSALGRIIDEGLLWAVPKKRRSLEKRLTRRMGASRLLVPLKNLVVCDNCGGFHQVHNVCGTCYARVKEETKAMQEAVMSEWKLDPIDKEVVIVYKNEQGPDRRPEGRRVVELPRERPAWFSRNLLAKDSEIARPRTSAVGETTFSADVHDTKT